MSTQDVSGITSHSNATGGEHFVIFASDWDTHRTQYFMAQKFPLAYGYKELVGSWQGQIEASYIVNRRMFIEHIMPSGMLDDQECVIILGPCDARDMRNAKLWQVTDMWDGEALPAKLIRLTQPVNLGKFHSVPKEYAFRWDGWTYDPGTGEYYICTKEETDDPTI